MQRQPRPTTSQPEEIIQATRDHSVVQLLVDKGEITADEARFHPKSISSRGLGRHVLIDLDYCECPLEATMRW